MRDDAIMAGDDATATWYVRARGRILGPLTWEQLEALRHRGQLARFDQVSRDRQNWEAADRLERLFPRGGAGGAFVVGPATREPSRKRQPEPEPVDFLILDDESRGAPATASGPQPGAADESAGWYYAEAGAPQGPVDYPELKRLARVARIGPGTLYWRSGLDQWTPGTDLPELKRLWPSPADPSAASGGASRPPGPSPRVNPLAFISLASNLFCGIGNLAAIAVGAFALRQIARSNGGLTGRNHALIGIALGIAGLAATAIAWFWLLPGGGE